MALYKFCDRYLKYPQVFFLTISIFIICSCSVYAQGGKGKISGKLYDAKTNELLIGVNIRLEGTKQGATTDQNGNYYILNIAPGVYSVTASMIGYGSVTKKSVEVYIDRTSTVDFKLSDATVQMQAITVVAEKPTIIKDQTSSSTTVDAEQISSAPVEGLRGVLDYNSSFQKNEKGEYQVRGSGSNEVAFQVNGVAQTNSNDAIPAYGAATKADNSWKYDVNPLGVQQMQLITGGFQSEYGNAQAGIVKVVLKEGSPKFTGEARVEYRPAGQYHWGKYLYDKSNFEWQTWGNLNYWMQQKDAAASSPSSNIFTQLGMNSTTRYATLYNKVYVTKDASEAEKAQWDSLANKEIQWAYNQWVKLHTPSADNPLGVYDYRKLSYYRATFGFGGPLSKNPDLLRFFLSGEYLNKPTRIPSTEQNQIKQNYTLTLTSTAIPDNKFKFTGTFLRYVGGLFSGSDDIRWSGIQNGSVSEKYFVNRDPVRTEQTTSQSLTHTYTINEHSFIETIATHQYEKYELPYRYLLTWNDQNDRLDGSNDAVGTLLTRGDWWDQTYFMSYENIATDFFQDNRASTYTLKSDYSNQLNNYNFFKSGFEFNYSDLINTGVTYNYKANAYIAQQGVAEHYTAYPVSGAYYVQDKMEYEGMVANIGLRAEAYNYQALVPTDIYDIFYQGTQGSGYTGSLTTKKSDTKYIFLPRLGLSFPIGEATAFRLQFGHFASMPTFAQALGNQIYNGWNVRGNPNLDPKKTINYEVGLQQMVDQDNRLDIAVYYNDRVTQIGTISIASYTGNIKNLAGYAEDNTQLYTYTTYANNSFGSTLGMDITLEKVTVGDITYRLNYTLSQTRTGTYGSTVLYPDGASKSDNRITSAAALSPDDRTHKFRGQIQYNMGDETGFRLLGIRPFENSLFSLTYTVQSGLPFTYQTASDLKDVVYNKRYPLESGFDFNFTRNFIWGSTKLIFSIRVMNLFNNRWLTPMGNATNTTTSSTNIYKDDLVRWMNNGVTMDQADDPSKTSYLLYPYMTYRNIPRQIYFTIGVGL